MLKVYRPQTKLPAYDNFVFEVSASLPAFDICQWFEFDLTTTEQRWERARARSNYHTVCSVILVSAWFNFHKGISSK